MPNSATADKLHKFHFLDAPVRGIWVRLQSSWQDACNHRGYPQPVLDLLGQMMAVTTMVANNVREEPSIVLQAVGSGPVKLAFAECREHKFVRSIAKIDEDDPDSVFEKHTFRDLLGTGQLALTMLLKNGSTYQGRVELDSDNLLINLENYFKNSEQLATHLKVSCREGTVTGCLLQLLPSQNTTDDELIQWDEIRWQQISSLFKGQSGEPREDQDTQQYLRDLYPHERIYLDEAIDLSFKCTCSRERGERAIRLLTVAELEEILATEKVVTVSCEFCGKTYLFDRMTVANLGRQEEN